MDITSAIEGKDQAFLLDRLISSQPQAEWIVKRREEAARTGDTDMSQMHFARKGRITEEMAYMAHKQKTLAERVRSQIAKGTMIMPANINHPEL